MSGLRLGDIILDPRRALYLPSLKAVVCSGLHEALRVPIAAGLRSSIERVDSLLDEYKPESLIVLGTLNPGTTASYQSVLSGISRRWGKRVRIILVAQSPDAEAAAMAEALGCEVHHELVWGKYRFVDRDEPKQLDFEFSTIAGQPHYGVKVGRSAFGGMKLAVFLKGLGRLTLPSLDPNAAMTSVFQKDLERCDVFAVGHQRVLPLGKVGDLKPFKGIVRGLPISKATLGVRRRVPKEPSAD